ncbi:NAD(P)-dependent alcohol dehydrogenase [Nocardioides sp. Soil805]|uniref:NAD(P)-dependent alcohol dehydrogenase n=1 Tax=Nocardioides sp. Soil805 TaxID=1736416 RepID=UPI00070305D1|nr:NAD(P)-dependent alcohol dehydrogenase [Nocardioides sp. Soil805]KRF37659.1 alcohol dehydrogenase [Nocardioides sp. Soil805]
MRAAVVHEYGAPDVARVVEVDTPTPGAKDVLVRVHAAAVTSADARIRGARFPRGFAPFARLAFGLRRPGRPVLGGTFSGVVEAVGDRVTGVSVGDAVVGTTGLRMGTHAELVVVPASRVVPKPAGVSHDDAAGVLFGGQTALFFLRDKATVGPGTRVLVNGASGAIGTSAVQLAKHLGATVTGVTSGANADLVRGLGADHVVDHTTTDLASLPERYDVVLDTVGNVSPASGRRLLADGGVLLLAVADLGEMLRARGDVKAGTAPERPEDARELLALVASGALRVVIDAALPLDDVAVAHARVDSGHKVGNVVVHP